MSISTEILLWAAAIMGGGYLGFYLQLRAFGQQIKEARRIAISNQEKLIELTEVPEDLLQMNANIINLLSIQKDTDK